MKFVIWKNIRFINNISIIKTQERSAASHIIISDCDIGICCQLWYVQKRRTDSDTTLHITYYDLELDSQKQWCCLNWSKDVALLSVSFRLQRSQLWISHPTSTLTTLRHWHSNLQYCSMQVLWEYVLTCCGLPLL